MITLGHHGPQRLRQIHGHGGVFGPRCAAGRCRPDQPRDFAARLAAAAPAGPAVRRRHFKSRRHTGPPPAGDRAFATPEGKAALDSLTHPEIVRRIRAAKQAAQDAGAPLFVLDGAVIVGTAAQAECDRLCVVTAPFETSVARIVARDGISPEMAARRLNAQTPESTLTAQADYVLRNDSSLAHLQAAAARLCVQLLAEGACGKRTLNKRYNEQDPAPQYDPETARIRRALRAQKARRRKKMRSRRLFAAGHGAEWCCLCVVPNLWGRAERLFYPRKYEALVEQWAQTYEP